MRIVLDTNVLVSALITSDTPPDLLYNLWDSGSFELVTSAAQLDELARVLAYKRLRTFFTREEGTIVLETIRARALVVEELPDVELCSDPDDNRILATAIAGHAAFLVTGDAVLLGSQVPDLAILTPRDALERIQNPT